MTPKYSLAAMLVSLMILCCACAGGHAAEKSQSKTMSEVGHSTKQTTGPIETRKLESPVIRATTLPLPSATAVSSISGVIYITRAGMAIKNPPVGESIHSGDLLQITEGSSISLRRQGDKDITLTRQHGEWFKFE